MGRFSVRELEREYGYEGQEDEALARVSRRQRIMPYPASLRAEKDYKAYCRKYRSRFGHLTIPTSLPLHLVRRSASIDRPAFEAPPKTGPFHISGLDRKPV